jgi:hypothetical protein
MCEEDILLFLERLLAKLVQTWLTEHTRLKSIYLPIHCSHLNPVEEIWLHLNVCIAANRLYTCVKLLPHGRCFLQRDDPGEER